MEFDINKLLEELRNNKEFKDSVEKSLNKFFSAAAKENKVRDELLTTTENLFYKYLSTKDKYVSFEKYLAHYWKIRSEYPYKLKFFKPREQMEAVVENFYKRTEDFYISSDGCYVVSTKLEKIDYEVVDRSFIL